MTTDVHAGGINWEIVTRLPRRDFSALYNADFSESEVCTNLGVWNLMHDEHEQLAAVAA